MARIKKEEKKSNITMVILVGIMFFGTIAGGLLFRNPVPEEQLTNTSTLPVPPTPQGETMTIKHNPVNTTVLTALGYQAISYDDTHIFIDSNHPLTGKTLTFDIRVVNATRENYTVDPRIMTVENGDAVEVDYTGRLESGEVFDTTHAGIAKNASVPKTSWFGERPFYEPLEFIVGAGTMIGGFDEAVVGMKMNETNTVEIPPEKAYGLYDPSLVEAVPIIQEIQKTMQIRKFMEFTTEEFQRNFGSVNMTQGQTFNVPGTNFNASVYYTTGDMAVVEMLPKQGDVIRMYEYPWNSTVVSVGPGSIILEHDIKGGDTIQFPGMPWNTTVQ